MTGNKKILTTTAAFGLLRKALIENLGPKRAKGFLLRYGWSLGNSDALEAMKRGTSIQFLIEQALILHLNTGHIGNMHSERHVEIVDNRLVGIRAKGTWVDSFEALEHLKHHGIADHPVCYTLTGYATGYMTTICRRDVIVVETSCIGRGDAACRYETRLREDWGNEIDEEIQLYQEHNILEELEYTYEQLLEQRNFIDKVSKIHKLLTESITSGSNLQDIVNIAYDLLQIPVSIEDLGWQKIAFSGVMPDVYDGLQADFRQHMLRKSSRDEQLIFMRDPIKIRTTMQERLIAPIVVQNKVIGYCSFIYIADQGRRTAEPNDALLLERVANAASLYLLNEKTSFEALERMKGFFLEQILKGSYTSREEIVNRGRYIGFNFEGPLYMAAIQHQGKMPDAPRDAVHYGEMLETIAKYLDIQGHKVLFGQHEGFLIMLLLANSMDEPQVKSIMEKILSRLESSYPGRRYKIGVSDRFENIMEISDYLEEATIALRMTTNKKIVHYSELGIFGVLINSKNVDGIIKIAKRELGPLYDPQDPKKMELLRTLYVFLSNRGKIQQTMADLNLSTSGLMYRLGKIEKLIQKDIRDTTQGYQLLLILDSLVALAEIEL
jgi:sugar diacid utilization regulator